LDVNTNSNISPERSGTVNTTYTHEKSPETIISGTIVGSDPS